MILSLLRQSTGWVALLGACGFAVACSNSSSPPADAFVAASVGTGPMSDSTMCPLGGLAAAWLSVGTPTGGNPTTVQDGGNNGNGNVAVACKVTPSGNGFDIELSVDQSGTQGASMTITGSVDPTSGGTGITGTFTSYSDGGPYTSNACVITYEYNMAAVPVSPPVAGGRIWGHIECPVAMLGGQPGKQCDARADFLFEQCSQ